MYSQVFIELHGTIVDSQSNEPLAYASVALKNKLLGTVSNQDGSFVLKVPKNETGDTLNITYLGYLPLQLPVKNLIDVKPKISLELLTYFVKEISITPNAATNLLKEVKSKIAQNYSDKPINLKTFYRETITENNKCIQQIEAVMEIYKNSYTLSRAADMIRILKGREKKDVAPSVLWNYIDFVDGPYEALTSDVIKYQTNFLRVPQNQTNFLDEKNFRFYDYHLTENFNYQSQTVYLIDFKPKKKPRRGAYEGQIYIDKNTLAIIGMFYRIADDKINQVDIIDYDTRKALMSNKIDINTIDFYCEVNYIFQNNKWYLSNILLDYKLALYGSPDHFFSNINTSIDMIVTEIDTVNVKPFKSDDMVEKRKSLHNQLGEQDDRFWENYNFMPIEKVEVIKK